MKHGLDVLKGVFKEEEIVINLKFVDRVLCYNYYSAHTVLIDFLLSRYSRFMVLKFAK